MTKAKDKPINPEAIHMVFGNKSDEKDATKEVGATGWLMAWETKRTEFDDILPVKKGNLIRAKQAMSHGINPGDVVMFLHYEELILNTDIKFDVRIDQDSIWDAEKNEAKISKAELEEFQKQVVELNQPKTIKSCHVNVLIAEKTVNVSIESKEKFFDYFEIVGNK